MTLELSIVISVLSVSFALYSGISNLHAIIILGKEVIGVLAGYGTHRKIIQNQKTTLTIQDGSIPNVHLSANCFEFGPLSTHIDFILH
mgnify:CR=1 FL=1